MLSRGRARKQRREAQAARIRQVTSIPGGPRRVMQEAAAEVSAELRRWLARKGPGLRSAARPLLKQVRAEVAAVIVCRTAIDALTREGKITATAMQVGSRIEDEVRFTQLRREAPQLVAKVEERFKRAHSRDYRHRRTVLARLQTQEGIQGVSPWVAWTPEQKLHVGALLLSLLIETGYVAKRILSNGKRSSLRLMATTKLIEGMRQPSGMGLVPWFMPMTEPPFDWDEDGKNGGYRLIRLPLVKAERALGDGKIETLSPTLVKAVNAAQRTTWEVNARVLRVAEELFSRGYEAAGLPSTTETPLPPKPEWLGDARGKDLKGELRVEFKAWKRACADALTTEIRRRSHVLSTRTTLDLAGELADKPLWFPHQVDWRGRMYPVPIFLQPQGEDLSRGLLRFREGKMLGADGGYWLAVHGANCWGIDKVPFAARIEWVEENSEMIFAIAADPLANRKWVEADQPFQFLAWCLEWADYAASFYEETFVSHLAVGMDGTCNGLQHFSAIMRDTVGGSAVNLVPGPGPRDIYGTVAEHVHQAVLASSDGPCAEWWKEHGVKRDVVKRQVMTLPYGVTWKGALEQLRMHLDKEPGIAGSTASSMARWLHPLVWERIEGVVGPALEAMKWLQEVARVLAQGEQGVRWRTPHGLTIVQQYQADEEKIVKTQLMGKAYLTLRVPVDGLAKRRQVSGIAPNFVHSLDAAHLCRTIEYMEELGAEPSWCVVHDSYGVHAADVSLLRQVLRVTFVELHRADALGLVEIPAGTEVPAPPPKGDLDLEAVLLSRYFFA